MKHSLEQIFEKAYQLQQEGKLTEAIACYESILGQEPQHSPTLHFIGLAHAQAQDLDKALLYLQQAVHLHPHDASMHNNLGNVYKKAHLWDEAINEYQAALAIHPEYAQAHNNLATVYALKNDYTHALKHYAQAVQAEPDFSAAHFNLGLLLLKNNQFSAAKIQFNNVIRLNPDYTEAHFYLGILNLEENTLDEAKSAFEQVLQQDAEHIEALVNLGVIALKSNHNQQAVDYFTKALALDNHHLEARNNLAATFMHFDRFENALMHYDVLLQTDPQNIEYLYNSGVAQMALGHLNEAIVYFERIISQMPHAPSLNNLAAVYLKMEQRETAREYLKQALAENPEDAVSAHMLAALEGEQHAPTSTEYAHNLFNNYALYYDQHMQGTLHYTLPQHIAKLLHQYSLPTSLHTLDLGCGTGLTGIVLREASTTLTGVDIAEKMVAQARDKNLYDQLVTADIQEFLAQDLQQYGLIVAADVLPYFGSLEELFSQISAHCLPEGYFLFSVEITTNYPWQLQTTARFSHHPSYLRQLAHQYGFTILQEELVPARKQNEEWLEVMLFVLQFNGSA
ncbi:MAG: methyltransferase [Legionella sp. 40-6]|nr:tetratricopeptide repeat protein [Legionella sp.]OJY32017.1 MAG: methyltransferase [Legionella sp. 40-6]